MAARKWTEAQKLKQAGKIKGWKPWEKSTGPITKKGKDRVARNALKEGLHNAQIQKIKANQETILRGLRSGEGNYPLYEQLDKENFQLLQDLKQAPESRKQQMRLLEYMEKRQVLVCVKVQDSFQKLMRAELEGDELHSTA